MNEPITLNNLPPNKSAISAYAERTISELLDSGLYSPFEIITRAAVMDEASKKLRADDALREACIAEYEKYGTREAITYHDVKITVKETGVSYDYEPCGDPVHARLLQEKEAIDAKLKEREKFLQHLPVEGVETIDEETGEITRIYPPSRTSKTGVQVTLPR